MAAALALGGILSACHLPAPGQDQPSANLSIKGVKLGKAFGRISGRAILDDGQVLELENLLGCAEEVYIRWYPRTDSGNQVQ